MISNYKIFYKTITAVKSLRSTYKSIFINLMNKYANIVKDITIVDINIASRRACNTISYTLYILIKFEMDL